VRKEKLWGATEMQKIISADSLKERPSLARQNSILAAAYILNFLISVLVALGLIPWIPSLLFGLSAEFVCLSANLLGYVVLACIGYLYCFQPWSKEFSEQ
jgi:hypothetical protein